MNKDMFTDQEEQLLISYELICLLEWLVTYQSEELQALILHAVQNGLTNNIKNKENKKRLLSHETHTIIADFFKLLEENLQKATTSELTKQIKEKNVLTALKQLDVSIYDTNNIKKVISTVSQEIEKNPTINAKEKLLQELLKQWNPNEKELTN